MRTGTGADVVVAPPVDQVVTRAGRAPASKVGDLVGLEPSGGQSVDGRVVEGDGGFRLRRLEEAATGGACERRAGLKGELVRGQVLRPDVRRLVERGSPTLRRLARQGVDQVERHPRRGGERQIDGPARLGRIVVALQEAERRVVESLHADREPVHPRLRQGGEPDPVRVGGIGLQGHLQLADRRPEPPGGVDQAADVLRVHQRRRAAAEVDRMQDRERPGRRHQRRMA